MKLFKLLAFAAALTASACGQPQSPPASAHLDPVLPAPPQVALIRQVDTPDRLELQALGGGTLEIQEGCLRIRNPNDSRLLIWPPNVALTPEGDGVVDPTTGTAVRIGEQIIIGGGEIPGINPAGLADPIPPACAGPYWLGASGFFAAPREDWQTVRIAERYSIKLPAETAAANPKPSSLPAEWSAGGLSLRISEGANVCERPAASPGVWAYNVYTDQRLAHVTRGKPTVNPSTFTAIFKGVDGPRGVTPARGEICLRIEADCTSQQACDTARSAISTIRFGDLGEPA